jgi:hypothetical protein
MINIKNCNQIAVKRGIEVLKKLSGAHETSQRQGEEKNMKERNGYSYKIKGNIE